MSEAKSGQMAREESRPVTAALSTYLRLANRWLDIRSGFRVVLWCHYNIIVI